MNAIERSERRVKRLVVLKRIYEIEYANCRKCPNRGDQKRQFCETCPVMKKLSAYGSDLSLINFREQPPKELQNVEPQVVKKRRRPLNSNDFIAGIAKHKNIARLARTLEIPEQTLRNRAMVLGLNGLKQSEALEILGRKKKLEVAK